MAFQIKDFTSIAASMMNWMRATQTKVTDFNAGSVVRTMVEAPAAEIDELYQNMFIGLKEGIEASVYSSFDFDAITSVAATGLIRVTVVSSVDPIAIPAGTQFSMEGSDISYLSNNDVVIPAGSTFADILVACAVPGSVGNIPSGLSFSAAPEIFGFVSAANMAAFISGLDAESPDDRKLRFNAFIASLPRGTNAALTYGLRLAYLTDSSGSKTEQVVSSSIIEPWVTDSLAPISLVNCYIHNGSGGTSGDLVTRAREIIYGYRDENDLPIPGWKAAGVKVDVFAATEVAVNVTGMLTAVPGYDKPSLIVLAQQAAYAYIVSLGIGESVIHAEIVSQIMNIDGVANIVLSAPTADVAANSQTKLMPGTIALT